MSARDQSESYVRTIARQHQEICRLQAFLLEQDTQINEETERSSLRIAQLEQVITRQGEAIAELQQQIERHQDKLVEQRECRQIEQDEDYVDQIVADNERLKTMLTELDRELAEKNQTCANLQSALTLVQASMKTEIETALAESRMHLQQERDAHQKVLGEVEELNIKLADHQMNSRLMAKLVTDLDVRNNLIDELNEEVNRLKRVLAELRGGSLDHPGGLIDRRYVCNLLLSLYDPPDGVERAELGRLLADALGMNEAERAVIGLDKGHAKLEQGFTDLWISFLLHESSATPPPAKTDRE